MLKKKRFNMFAKRCGDKALVHEEYLSEDEEDGDHEHKGMAAIAMHSKSSFTSSSLFDSPNENKPNFHRCLMDKEVISKSIKPTPSSPANNLSKRELEKECEDDGVDYSEESSLAFMKTLKGEYLAR